MHHKLYIILIKMHLTNFLSDKTHHGLLFINQSIPFIMEDLLKRIETYKSYDTITEEMVNILEEDS